MGIQINGNTNNINAGIGSLSIEDINELDIVGVATAANFKTGVSNLHSVGLSLSGGQIDVGSNIKLGNAGVITATSFVGSGANLTGIDTDLVSDTSPQLGGDLASNSHDVLFADNDKAIFGTGSDFKIYHNGTDNYIMASNGHIRFDTGSAELARITSTGKLLVGTQTEGETTADNLTIADSGHCGITIRSGTSSEGNIFFSDGTSGADEYRGIIRFEHSTNAMVFKTVSAERLRITSTGQVRIGNSNNLALWGQNNRLQVAGTDWSSSGITIACMGTSGSSNLVMGNSRGSTPGTVLQSGDRLGYISFVGDDGTDMHTVGAAIVAETDGNSSSNSVPGDLQFYTGGNQSANERLRITSGGEVGINVTNPEVYGSGHGFPGLVVKGSSGNYSGITIRSGYNGGGGLMFSDGTGSSAELYNVALTADHTNKRLNFYVDGSTVCRLTEYGFHPNPSDSAASTALDDYEEGTFSFNESNISVSNYEAKYTKIGRVVMCSARINFGSSSHTGTLNMTGLPFTADSNAGNSNCGGVIPEQNVGVGAIFMAIEHGNGSVRIRNSSGSVLNPATVSGKSIRFVLHYIAAS